MTSAYKKMMEKVSFGDFSAKSLPGTSSADLDSYVTHKALDGLFLRIGEEESGSARIPLHERLTCCKKCSVPCRRIRPGLEPEGRVGVRPRFAPAVA